MSRTISILGSTGSIGETTLRVVRFLKDEYRVYGLACGGNIGLLERQIAGIQARAVVAVGLAGCSGIRGVPRAEAKKFPEVEFLDGEDGLASWPAGTLTCWSRRSSARRASGRRWRRWGRRSGWPGEQGDPGHGRRYRQREAAGLGRGADPGGQRAQRGLLASLRGLAAAEIERIILTASGGACARRRSRSLTG